MKRAIGRGILGAAILMSLAFVIVGCNSDESTKTATTTTSDPNPCDLRVVSVTCPSSATKGTSFTVTDVTSNSVALTEIGSTTHVYLCSDTNNVMSTRCSSKTHPVGILNVGQTTTKNCSIYVSNSCAGTMWVVVIANKSGALSETTRANNTNVCGPITISP